MPSEVVAQLAQMFAKDEADVEALLAEEIAKLPRFEADTREIQIKRVPIVVGSDYSGQYEGDWKLVAVDEGTVYFLRASRTKAEAEQAAAQAVVGRLANETQENTAAEVALADNAEADDGAALTSALEADDEQAAA